MLTFSLYSLISPRYTIARGVLILVRQEKERRVVLRTGMMRIMTTVCGQGSGG